MQLMASAKKPRPGQSPAVERIADQCIAVRLRMLNRVVTGVYDEATRPLGVTAGQVNILVTVEALEQPSAAEVGRVLYMEKSTLSRNVERLRRKGWLQTSEADDGRSQRLSVTARGRNLIDRVLPVWEEAQQRARRIIGSEGERALRAAADGLWTGPDPD